MIKIIKNNHLLYFCDPPENHLGFNPDSQPVRKLNPHPNPNLKSESFPENTWDPNSHLLSGVGLIKYLKNGRCFSS